MKSATIINPADFIFRVLIAGISPSTPKIFESIYQEAVLNTY